MILFRQLCISSLEMLILDNSISDDLMKRPCISFHSRSNVNVLLHDVRKMVVWTIIESLWPQKWCEDDLKSLCVCEAVNSIC